MKVDLVYTMHYIDHPFDKKVGCKVYCLCREVRTEALPGLRGANISYNPVAVFESSTEANIFQRTCAVDFPGIELSHDIRELLDSEAKLSKSRSK